MITQPAINKSNINKLYIKVTIISAAIWESQELVRIQSIWTEESYYTKEIWDYRKWKKDIYKVYKSRSMTESTRIWLFSQK